MIQTVEAMIDERGAVHLLQPVRVSVPRRALITILEEQPASDIFETAELNGSDLTEDWQRPQDDMGALLREFAAWEAASDEDMLKVEKMLADRSHHDLDEPA
jgi:hypothetical protein